MNSKPINPNLIEFVRQLLYKYGDVRKKHIELYGRDVPMSSGASSALCVTKDIIQRYKKFPANAKMTLQEEMQLRDFGEWLLKQWHLMHGTDPEQIPDSTRFYRPVI